MARVYPFRGVWRRGVAISETMKGSILILPRLGPPVHILLQEQAPYISSVSTSCSTILSSHFRPCRRVRHHSSHTIRHQWQRVLLLLNKLQNGSFCVKHFQSSFHGDAIAFKQQRPKEKFEDASNLYPTREPKRTVDVQSFNRPLNESHRPPGNYPSRVTQLPTTVEPQFFSASEDQSKTWDLNAPGNLNQSTSSSTLEVVQPGWKASSKPVPTFSSISEHRAEKITSEQSHYGSRGRSRETAQGNRSTHIQSAGTTSEAIDALKNRLQRGITTDPHTYVKVLQICLKQKDLLAIKQVHDCIIESGMGQNPHVASTLLNVYIKCGGLLDARRVFDELEKKSVITWTMMIAGYAGCDHSESALELFKLMRQEGVRPNEVTYLCILKACASPLALQWGKEVHVCIRHAGFELDVRVGTALIQMYAKCGCITEARRVFDKLTNRNFITWSVMIGAYAAIGDIDYARRMFDRMKKRDLITWNIMIGAYAESGRHVEAYRLFRQMRKEGFEPDPFTFASLLNASASAGTLEWVKEVHRHVTKAGVESDVRVGNALLHMYAKSGSLDDARLIFNRLKKLTVITWNIIISAYAARGRGEEAYQLFLEMRREGFEPDAFTYASVLNASPSTGALEWVKEVHGQAKKAGVESDLRVGNALIHMYAESGSIDDARVVFDTMERRDVVTWTTMIDGLAHHGCGHEALAFFRKMNADLVKPNETTFVAVLSACCHGGLLEDGRRLFSAMTQDFGIVPDIVHYTCMVDILGRAGHLEEAKRLIIDMPIEPDVVTWTSLLGACRTYRNVELGELVAEELFKLEPNKASTYVLLSNIYAAAGKWEKVSQVRTLMEDRDVWKEPGRSWIVVDNKTHEFVAGDTSHPEAEAIYTYLNNLTETLKAEGYIPDTQLVLQNIDEEDKELALCSHSEKWAIAYGLMRIPRGNPIRVFKNLRVCSDCHSATKCISKVTGREIISRDATRFHHFKDGVCSCGDYW